MLDRLLLVSMILIMPYSTFAVGGCLIPQALKDPRLASNPQFWDDYARLNNSRLSTEKDLEALVKKYQTAVPDTSTSAAPFTPSKTFNIHRKAQKEVEHLPKDLKEKFDEFLSVSTKSNGMNELFSNPGRWHFEKLPEFGAHAHSVRLNDGYRVLFDVVGDRIDIRRVNKGQIHGN